MMNVVNNDSAKLQLASTVIVSMLTRAVMTLYFHCTIIVARRFTILTMLSEYLRKIKKKKPLTLLIFH